MTGTQNAQEEGQEPSHPGGKAGLRRPHDSLMAETLG